MSLKKVDLKAERPGQMPTPGRARGGLKADSSDKAPVDAQRGARNR